jgi:phage-related protein
MLVVEVVLVVLEAAVEQGVWDAANALLNSVVDAMRRALEAAKRALGIGSPSKEFAKGVGKPIMQGVEVGIDDGAGGVDDTLGKRLRDLLGTAETGSAGMAQAIGDTLLERVKAAIEQMREMMRNFLGELRGMFVSEFGALRAEFEDFSMSLIDLALNTTRELKRFYGAEYARWPCVTS